MLFLYSFNLEKSRADFDLNENENEKILVWSSELALNYRWNCMGKKSVDTFQIVDQI